MTTLNPEKEGRAVDKPLSTMAQRWSEAFAGRVRGEGDVALPGRLDRSRLDYSLSSLEEVDRYLEYLVRNRPEMTSQAYRNTVLWGGAYVGEVIRQNAERTLRWVEREECLRRHPHLRPVLPPALTTQRLLCTTDGTAIAPIAAFARFLGEGPVNRVRFYGALECSKTWDEHVPAVIDDTSVPAAA